LLAIRKHFFQTASDLHGAWLSSDPRTLALLQRGTMYLADASLANSEAYAGIDSGSLDCALAFFQRALRMVHREFAQSLYAAILNNAAVACLAHTVRPFECGQAERWLTEASQMRTRTGQVPRAARAAMYNLALVKREGLF
jgi:hypothetical protein